MTLETLTTRLNEVKKHLTAALDENLEFTREIDRLKKELSARDDEIFEPEAKAMILKGLQWFKDRECLDELPDEVLDLVVGNTVSIDVSTGEADAGNRVFGDIVEWQDEGPKGDRVWLCTLDHFNYKAYPGVSGPNERGKNRHGLDMAYFRKLFNRELNRPLTDFRPDELARVLARAARTADAEVLQELEFCVAQPTQTELQSDLKGTDCELAGIATPYKRAQGMTQCVFMANAVPAGTKLYTQPASTTRPSLGQRKAVQAGTIIGVLVQREAGGIMAVTDLGRCTLLHQNVIGPSDGMSIPDGWRDLEIGEKKMVGDRFLAVDGKWTEMRPEHLGFENYVSPATRPMQRNVHADITPSSAGDQAASLPEPTREDAIATLAVLGDTDPGRDDVDMLHGGLMAYHEILSNKRKVAQDRGIFDSGVGQLCAPGPAEGQMRAWILKLEDQQRGDLIYYDVHEALGAFERAERLGWNCHLFVSADRTPSTDGHSTSAGTDWVNIIEENCWDLRCTSEPIGGDDSEVLWHIIEHHMAEPHERTIASDLNLTQALQRALNPQLEQGDE
jgi:hypothetical protein